MTPSSRSPTAFTATFLQAINDAKFSRITSVCVVARTKDGLIVALEQPRGLDIPGGHLETILDPENRQTREQPEEALVRECLEEASMYITNIRHFVTIHTDQGYMLSFLAEVESLETFDASKTNGEVLSRRLMTPVDFLAKTQDTPLVHEIVRRANILWCDPNTGTLQFPDQSFTIDPSNEGSRAWVGPAVTVK